MKDHEGIIGDIVESAISDSKIVRDLMNKRDIIREGMRLIWNDYKFGDHINKPDSVWVVDEILTYLDSMGVVIKTDMGLPEYVDCGGTLDSHIQALAMEVQQDMLTAGYVFTERLIKE